MKSVLPAPSSGEDILMHLPLYVLTSLSKIKQTSHKVRIRKRKVYDKA